RPSANASQHSRSRSACSPGSSRARSRPRCSRAWSMDRSMWSSGPTGCCPRTYGSRTSGWLWSEDRGCEDLGGVVVDEEPRLGVGAKERLKQLRREVDVLTLSATPIPRTLNLALAGVRDMSVIETPPEARLPIQPRVAEASAGLVRDAILRELDRGGQV